MKAVVVEKGGNKPRIANIPEPERKPGEVLVRTLRVGVDGTDHEVIAGSHGGFPEGEDYLVLGHEAVGVVEEPGETGLSRGGIVVPTVRRPIEDGNPNKYFERDEPDMAPIDECVELGISGGHGYMSKYFTAPEEYLVEIPRELAEKGILVEPVSISEKAIELAEASRSTFEWDQEAALVLGDGNLGLLTLNMLDSYDRVYCLGRSDEGSLKKQLVERTGATYIDSRETPLTEVGKEYEEMDFIYEATGHAKHAYECIESLAPNGVASLLGVPEPGWEFEIDGSKIHNEIVLENKAVVGSVNSNLRHFEDAVETLMDMEQDFLEDFVTGVYELDSFEKAFEDSDASIKEVVKFSELN